MEGKPTLHVIAGPEGSGKTTYYEQQMLGNSKVAPELRSHYISADKVHISPDRVQQQLGEQSTRAFGAGNLIAQQQARETIGDRKSLIYETSLSDRSDLALIDHAKQNGFRVVITHVQTVSPELNQARIDERVREGGRAAPAGVAAQQYETSPKLIAEAVKKADYAFVQDTSALNQSPKHLITFQQGRVTNAAPHADMPKWAAQAYGPQLQQHREANVSSAERSFHAAVDKAEQRVPGARVQIAGHKPGSYDGPIVDATAHHVLQQTGPTDFVAHFNARLAVEVHKDQNVSLNYSANRDPAKVTYNAPDAPRDAEKLKSEVRDFLTKPREQAVSNPRLEAAYSAYDALTSKAAEAGPRNDAVERDVNALIKNSIAARLSTGKNIEVNQAQVDSLQYQVASRSLDSALSEKAAYPDRNPRIDPEHRKIIVDRSEQIMRAAEGSVTQIKPESPEYKQAQAIAAKLAQHDGGRGESPFRNSELTKLYQHQQTELLRQQNQQSHQQARNQGAGL